MAVQRVNLHIWTWNSGIRTCDSVYYFGQQALKVALSQNVFHFGTNLKIRYQITILSTIHLKRRCLGLSFGTFFLDILAKVKNFLR